MKSDHLTPERRAEIEAARAALHAILSDGQEPLGAEFEKVWDANIADLYES